MLAALLTLALNAGRWKIFATVALALALIRVYPADEGRVTTVRSFFGVHKIVETPGGYFHVLMHGTTIHGAERFRNNDGTPVTGRPEPITYYHKDGGIGQAITALRERKGAPLKVAAIGVGSVCPAMIGPALDDDVAGAADGLALVHDQNDLAFEHDAIIDRLRAVHQRVPGACPCSI